MLTQTETEIKILDMGEAASLLSLGYELLRLEPTKRPRQRAFIFTVQPPEHISVQYPTAELVIEDYYNHRLAVEAYTFYMKIKEIKKRLHDNLEVGE